MYKILIWAKNNKINFNEQKSKVMVISRRKRKEGNFGLYEQQAVRTSSKN